MSNTDRRMKVCFEIELDVVPAYWIKRAIQDPTRAAWLRTRLEEAMEGFLSWIMQGGDSYRVKVMAGSIVETEGEDALHERVQGIDRPA